MVLVALSCGIILVSMHFTNTQAIYTAPVADDLRSLMSYDVDYGAKTSQSNDSDKIKEINEAKDPDLQPDEGQTIYMIEFESEPNEKDHVKGKNGRDNDSDMDHVSPLDPWSIVWYIGSFGGLVAFFLIVSCSEWCCRRGARPANTSYSGQRSGETVNTGHGVTETPPPPYHLFAPPPYDSVNYGQLVDKASGEKMNIYVISVPVQSTAQPAPA